ncbi:MAG: HD domain-containing protein [Patescibacteria group bacterium]
MGILVTLRDTIFDLEDVRELTPEILEICLEQAGVFPSVTRQYFENTDHGFRHSQAVWDRCQEIIRQSPLLWQMTKMQIDCTESCALKVLILASIFHDIGRFLGSSFETHEAVGAELARIIVEGSCIEEAFFHAILHHDYISPLVSGQEMPYSAMLPFSEIFRLADKTSISPKDEIRRYHQTGKRVAPDVPVFDLTIPDEIRFNFNSGFKKGDELSWFLIIFALQSTDFTYGDSRDAYAYWARGKREALETIGDLCLEEEYLEGKTPVDPNKAKDVIRRFCKKYDLILAT